LSPDATHRSLTAVPAVARISGPTVLAALQLARTGRVYDLALELNEGIPQGNPGAFTPFSFTWRVTPEGSGGDSPYRFAAETITGPLHIGTHIDALIHVQADGRIFGGELASDARDDRGFNAHGIETVPPIVTRGVVLDVAGRAGQPALADGYEITVADLQDACDAAGVQVREGDAVLVRTGKIREFATDPTRFQAGQPGVGVDAAIWLYDQGMAILATDTTGTEPLPFTDEARTTHRAMLVERGVHLVENALLDEVAAAGVSEGAFVCLPLKITGATGSWVRPVLVV